MILSQGSFAIAAIGDLSSGRIWAIVLGVLFAIVTITLLIASWTRWGQTKSLTKCIALAFLAHIWLLMYAYGTRIVVPGSGGGTGGGAHSERMAMTMNIIESLPAETPPEPEPTLDASESESDSDSKPNEEQGKSQAGDELDAPQKLAPWEAPLAKTESETKGKEQPEAPALAMPIATVKIADLMSTDQSIAELELPKLETPEELSRMAGLASVQQPLPKTQTESAPRSGQNGRAQLIQNATTQVRKVDQAAIPITYQMRLSPLRQQFAMMSGGDANTEAAVEKALGWLARSQSPDGSWNAAEHGAGREASAARTSADGEYRHNAGLKANTAMTGLALLAFLGAGHTHQEGRYMETVTKGLRYLLQQQLPSGDLSGRDQVGREPTVLFARMYSHGMAALAMTEAYSMTGDAALLPAIQSACGYTMYAMNPRTGGWRYSVPTEDPGDTSQFGWQAMTLNSATNNRAITLPSQTRQLMQRFLDSVSTGRAGGLAVYRVRQAGSAPFEQATPAMTAEALSSRLLLGIPVTPQAAEEAQKLLLKNLPGRSEENLYYWYYATMPMYQLRGDGDDSGQPAAAWNQWNDAMKQQLCATQIPRGTNDGSWNPTCIWGGYGGRVYSTAMACMCLEVYYRYLPMYKAEQFANQWQPARR